jgi:signal transduction histidine kinase
MMDRLIDPTPLPRPLAIIAVMLVTVLWLVNFDIGIDDVVWSVVGTCIVTVAFISLGIFRTHPRSRPWLILALNAVNLAGTIMMWVVATPWGLGGWPYVVVGAMVSFRLAPGLIIAAAACVPMSITVYRAMVAREEVRLSIPWLDREMFGLTLLLVIAIFMMKVLKRSYQELRTIQTLLAEVMDQNERNRRMLDLSHQIGHSLVETAARMDLLEMLVERHKYESLAPVIHQAGAETRDSLLRMRRVVLDLSSVSLTDQLDHSRHLLESAGVTVKQRVQGLDTICADESKVYAAILEQSVTSILQYSRASRARITVSGHRLTIEANGVGPPYDQQAESGMNVMKQRASEAGLTFRSEVSPDLAGLLVEVSKAPRKGDIE